MLFRRVQQIVEALVHNQQRTTGGAPFQDCFQQTPVCGPPGGVVGFAEKQHVQLRCNFRQDFLCHGEAVLRVQGESCYRTAAQGEGVLIFGESRGGDQSGLGPLCQRQPVNQVGRSVSAQDPLRRDVMILRQLLPQLPTQGVWIVLRPVQCLGCGLFYPLRYPKRADVGGEIQERKAILPLIAHPVSAVAQLHTNIPLASTSSVKHRKLPVYSIRTARRISPGSISRAGSPMVGLSCSCPK